MCPENAIVFPDPKRPFVPRRHWTEAQKKRHLLFNPVPWWALREEAEPNRPSQNASEAPSALAQQVKELAEEVGQLRLENRMLQKRIQALSQPPPPRGEGKVKETGPLKGISL